MHDTLDYVSKDPVYRQFHHHQMTFSIMYAFSENFILPLSPRRGRLRQGLAAGQDARRPLAAGGQPARAAARTCGRTRASSCCSWAASSARARSGPTAASLDWWLLEDPLHSGLQRLTGDLNRVYRATPALWSPGHHAGRLLLDRRQRRRQQHVLVPALGRRRLGAGLRGQLRRRAARGLPARAAAGRAAGRRSSTPTPSRTAGPGSATSARCTPGRAVARPAGLGDPAGAAARRALAALHRRAGLSRWLTPLTPGRLARCGGGLRTACRAGWSHGGAATRGGQLMSRWRRLVPATAVLAVLATGCTQQIPGLGSYCSGRSAVRRREDRRSATPTTARSTRWPATRSPTSRSSGPRRCQRCSTSATSRSRRSTRSTRTARSPRRAPRTPPTSAATRSTARPRTSSPGTARSCSRSCRSASATSWSRWCWRTSGGTRSRSGPSCPATSTIVVETQADCYAGAFTDWALKGNAPHFEIARPDLDRALSGFLLFRDPLGSDASDRQAHGSGFDRISAFQDGFEQGVPFCAKFNDDRTFTQAAFQNPTTSRTQGNLSARPDARPGTEGRRRVLERVVPEALRAAVEAAGRGPRRSPTRTGRSATGSRCSTRSTAPADDTVYYDTDALRRSTSRPRATSGRSRLVGIAYGQAVRQRRGESAATDSESVLLSAICATGGYARDAFSQTDPSSGCGCPPVTWTRRSGRCSTRPGPATSPRARDDRLRPRAGLPRRFQQRQELQVTPPGCAADAPTAADVQPGRRARCGRPWTTGPGTSLPGSAGWGYAGCVPAGRPRRLASASPACVRRRAAVRVVRPEPGRWRRSSLRRPRGRRRGRRTSAGVPGRAGLGGGGLVGGGRDGAGLGGAGLGGAGLRRGGLGGALPG